LKKPVFLTAAMCTAEVLGMLGISSFAALLTVFADEWTLSNTNAGLIGGLYFAGYVIGVPVLNSLTDRIDARIVYFGGMTTTGLAMLGFALTAQGFWSAAGWQMLAGAGLAGTYMPGLKALGERLGGRDQSRAVAFYTASYAIGMSFSYLASGEIARLLDWRAAFGAAALGSLAAMAIAGFALAGHRVARQPSPDTHLLDFRPVFANRAAMGYVLGYAAHVWELFGLRAWLVAFLVFAASLDPGAQGWLRPTVVATLFMLLGAPASVLGNELCLRFGRRRVISTIMLTSAGLSSVMGFLGAIDYTILAILCLAYGALLMADSASLTAGMVESAEPGYLGATMAVHSTLGFIGAAVAPPVFGLVLDLAGGRAEVSAWGFAFISLAAVAVLGPLALARGARRT
jgi:MFS family permease